MAINDSKLPIKTKAAVAVLDCAQLFEYNVTENEWMDLWMKCDPNGDKRLGEHMWGKFSGGERGENLLNTMGHADLATGRVLARMVVIRCQESDANVFNMYSNGEQRTNPHREEEIRELMRLHHVERSYAEKYVDKRLPHQRKG